MALLVSAALILFVWFAARDFGNALEEDGKRPPVRYLDDEE
ncbi:MAG: hypothetical protein AB7I34_11285 [Rhizobiaceae bacterium]